MLPNTARKPRFVKLKSVPSAVQLIALDIDGTLLPSVGGKVSARNRDALRSAENAGVEIVIATGRRHDFALPLIQPIGLQPETVMLTSNGSVTRTLGGRHIGHLVLNVETARALCPILRRFGGTTVFTFDREGPGSLAIESLDPLRSRITAWVDANRDAIVETTPLEQVFDAGEAPVQGMVCGGIAAMRAAQQWLESHEIAREVEIHHTEYPARDLSILDILPPGCSKGAALDRLLRERGIPREAVLAIGDNFNDLEMLELAGQPVVMANSAPGLLDVARERGWTLAPANDEDGVAAVIEHALAERSAHESRPVPSADRAKIAGIEHFQG